MDLIKAFDVVYRAARSCNTDGQSHDLINQALQIIARSLHITQGLPGYPQTKMEQEVQEK